MKDPHRAIAPNNGQPKPRQQGDDGLEEGPDRIDAAIGREHPIVGRAEPLDLAALLGKGLDDANARDGVGQHAGHLAPGAHAQGKPAPQPAADQMNEQGDNRQRQERRRGQGHVEPQEQGGRQQEHEHVVGEIQQIDRQKIADAIGVGADACNQVAGPLTAEELDGEAVQVLVGPISQVRGDPLAHPCQHVGPRQVSSHVSTKAPTKPARKNHTRLRGTLPGWL